MSDLSTLLRFFGAVQEAPTPVSNNDLRSGVLIADVLQKCAPAFFDADTFLNRNTDNWVMWRSNVTDLCQKLDQYATIALSARSSHVTDGIDPSAIARDGNVDMMTKLAELAAVCCIFSGYPAVINKIKGMEKADSDVLQKLVKQYSAVHGFQKAKKDAAPPSSTEGATGSSPAQAHSAAAMGLGGTTIREFDSNFSEEAFRRLRKENHDAQIALQAAQDSSKMLAAKTELLESQLREVEGKYKRVLESESSKGPSAKERDLTALLSRRDEAMMDLQGRLESMKEERNTAESKLEELLHEVSRQSTEAGKIQQKHEALQLRVQELSQELAVTKDKLDANVSQRLRLESEMANVDQEKADLNKKLHAAREATTQAKNDAAALSKEVGGLKEKVSKLEEQLVSHSVPVEGMGYGRSLGAESIVSSLPEEQVVTTGSVAVRPSEVVDAAAITAIVNGLREELAQEREKNAALRLETVGAEKLEEAAEVSAAALKKAAALEEELMKLKKEHERVVNEKMELEKLAGSNLEEGIAKGRAMCDDKLKTARTAMLAERALTVSTVYEVGVQNAQLQQMMLFGFGNADTAAQSGTGDAFTVSEFVKRAKLARTGIPQRGGTFLEKQRAQCFLGALCQLGDPES